MAIETEKQPYTTFTLVHMAVGGLLAWIGVPFWIAVLLAILFEIWENTSYGMAFFQYMSGLFLDITGLTFWEPFQGDSVLNSQIDNLFFVGGYLLVAWLMYRKGKTAYFLGPKIKSP